MNDDIFLKKTYAGIVEDNNDPKRLGRIKVRVFEVYSDIETQDIPWASPWKDLNGENFILPERGKVVTVIFENGDLYKPEYIYAEHFNINLENKLKQLSPDDYKSMKSILFNHKTQIYVNESEGLKIDHKFNNINITEKNINLNLKDNYGKINIGDESSNQESILGTNFLEWFDEFMNILSGQEGGPFLGNLASPVVPTPALLESIAKYKAFKQPKFLSKNVFIVDNYDVTSIRQNKEDRQNNTQIGDDYRSSTSNTNLVDFDLLDYDPLYGNGDETPSEGGQGGLSTSDGSNPDGNSGPIQLNGNTNPDINKILKTMNAKGYHVEEKPYYINIIGVRNQYEGEEYSNQFKDKMWAIWKNEEGQWESKTWSISTIPGSDKHKLKDGTRVGWKKFLSIERTKGGGILVPAQYLNIYSFYEATSTNKNAMKGKPFFHTDGRPQKAYRDKNFETNIITFSNKNNIDVGNHAMLIHRAFPGGTLVNNWSEGCQVLQKETDLDQLSNLARKHIQNGNGNRFHYTLITGKDIEEFGGDDFSNPTNQSSGFTEENKYPAPKPKIVPLKEYQKSKGLNPTGKIDKPTLNAIKSDLKINSDEELAHFMGQCHHETGGFTSGSENLNYSSSGLLNTFKKYFRSKEQADQYERKPVQIASRVYANRMGNSDEASQQGWLYRGRGSVQLTGKENYTAFSKSVNDPEVVNNPELVAEKYFFASAKFFFDKNNLWSIAKKGIDDNIIEKISRRVNGGTHGLEDRIRQTKYYYDMIKS